MASLTVKEFIDVVHRSHLIAKDQLIDALSDCKSEGSLPDAAEDVADCLHKKGLITAWQQKNLLLGKSRGFFLGNYRLLDHLGTGGMSTVFLARHNLIDRRVAIKVLPSSRVGDRSFLDRFEREARVTSRMSHRNIVRVFDIDEQRGTHFMVMEYVSGNDLKEIVKEQGPLSLRKAAHYIAQAAAGLQHAHERGLVHRDIKPANLVINEADVVKVLDLGLARVGDDDELASLTVDNAEHMMGTADFLAPEQARNAHAVDHRADIYSLGCTFYYLLTGHPPFTVGTIAQRILLHQTETPRDVRAERSDCPHAIADVCMTMLAKDPEDRFASAGMVADRLHQWLRRVGDKELPAGRVGNGDALAKPIGEDEAPAEPVPLELEPRHSELRTSPRPVQATTTDPAQRPNVPVESTPMKLIESRKARARQRVKAPLALWGFLVLSVVTCVILLVFLLLRAD